MPGRFTGRRVHEGQHVRRIHRQPILAECPGEVPRCLERGHGGGSVAGRSQEPTTLQQRADADAIVGWMVGIHVVQDRVAFVEAVLEPERACQLRPCLVGGDGIAVGPGGLDHRAETCLRCGRIVVVPEVVERGHRRHRSAGRSGQWTVSAR